MKYLPACIICVAVISIPLFADTNMRTPEITEYGKQGQAFAITSGNGIVTARTLPDAGAETHDGFFFRCFLGNGYGKTDFNSSSRIQIRGLETSLTFQLGFATVHNLIIFGQTGGLTYDKSMKLKTSDTSISSIRGAQYFTSAYGFGVCYYIMPENYFVSGSFLLYNSSLEGKYPDGSSHIETKYGKGFMYMFGKEWWISDNWGIGISLIYFFGNSKTGTSHFSRSYEVTDSMYGLAVTATYN